MATTEEGAPLTSGGSQSKLSTALFLVLVAALLVRVVTAAMDRQKESASASPEKAAPPLVRWVAAGEAESVSRKTGKPILYDFTAEWCPPCRRLDKEGWGDAAIASYLNESFVPVRVLDREREEGKNPERVAELQRRYSIEAFPALIVAAPDGKAVGREEGWGGKDNLRAFLEESMKKAAAPGAGSAIP
jgi:thiol-disulfide isomerase/thioredoxin